MNPDDSFAQARAYAQRGWFVLPLWWPTITGDCACGLSDCGSTGKHPIRRLVPHGLHDASERPDQVDEWWRLYPSANVGVRTGAASGILVLDVDGEAGRLALRGLVAHHGLFDTRWARTGSGWHAYFTHPGGTMPNSAGRLGAGLDVRGDGGYVVAPPSLHCTRQRYRWIGPEIDQSHLPAAPQWLIELAAPSACDDRKPHPIWLIPEDVQAYGAAAIRSEACGVANAPPGQRNDRLNRAAFRLGQLVAAGVVAEGLVATALVAAGLAAGPGETKIRSTVRRGLNAGKLQPRRLVLRGKGEQPC